MDLYTIERNLKQGKYHSSMLISVKYGTKIMHTTKKVQKNLQTDYRNIKILEKIIRLRLN